MLIRSQFVRRAAGGWTTRREALRNVYELELPAAQRGSRVGAAMAVELDALHRLPLIDDSLALFRAVAHR